MSKPLRVLIVEDSEDDALLLVHALQRSGYAPIFERVETAEAMTAALKKQVWDIICSDYNMPHFNVPEALKLLQQSGLDLPFIVISGTIGEDTAVATMKAGAHDYLMKGKLKRLAPAIERELRDAEVRRQRRQVEEDLQKAEQNFRNSMDSSPLGIRIVTEEGEPLYANQAILDIYGYSSVKELKTAPVIERHTPESYARYQERKEARKLGKPLPPDYEISIVRRDGEIRHLAVFRKEVLWDSQKQFQTLYLDITERKQLETQLVQAQKMKAIGTLAAGVAHDFNNLLTAILGYSQLALADLGDNESLRRDIEEIKNAGERAASLTRQLLTFSRQEVLQPKIFDLNALVTNIEKMLRRLIGEDIELVTVLEPRLKSIKADPGQIEQVIMNLVINARDAMPEGGKIIIKTESIFINEEYCKFYPDARTGEFVSLLVEDMGAGIDKEVMQHIFEPFFTTKEPGKGTGLGLSVVYGIVRQHGGWINAYSELGQGATLRVYLPSISEEVEIETKEGVSIEQLKGNGERILVVEDEEGIRVFVTRALGKNDYVVFEAANASEALDIFEREQGQFALVFSDVVLPDKNGLELVKQLLSLRPKLPILITSGYTDQKAHWPVIKERGFRFLQKPYSVTDLLQAVKKSIEQTK